MISALRKIEGRGELPGATSAVMEMCVDNPRSGIADLFATHPSIGRRVEALVQYAGGHDPGPFALPPPEGEPADEAPADRTSQDATAASGPWGSTQAGGPWSPPQDRN
jgi:heat shock protein HtpX